jgi:hypothetical protein
MNSPEQRNDAEIERLQRPLVEALCRDFGW